MQKNCHTTLEKTQFRQRHWETVYDTTKPHELSW